MIFGIGTDLVDIRRIDKLITKFGKHFEQKYFTEYEINTAKKRARYVESIAKMFSIKESFIKAVSGASGMKWHEIETDHHESGQPKLNLYGYAKKYLNEKTNNNFDTLVTVSDELPFVSSFVIIFQKF